MPPPGASASPGGAGALEIHHLAINSQNCDRLGLLRPPGAAGAQQPEQHFAVFLFCRNFPTVHRNFARFEALESLFNALSNNAQISMIKYLQKLEKIN